MIFSACEIGFAEGPVRNASESCWVEERSQRVPSDITTTWRKEEIRDVSEEEREALMAIFKEARKARLKKNGKRLALLEEKREARVRDEEGLVEEGRSRRRGRRKRNGERGEEKRKAFAN